MKSEIIAAVADAGFDVYMQDLTDSWLIFTDGVHLGTLQEGPWDGLSLSTIHKPSQRNGTGFWVADFIASIDAEHLRQAFALCPVWASREAGSIRKWRDAAEFFGDNAFNRRYRLVACAGADSADREDSDGRVGVGG